MVWSVKGSPSGLPDVVYRPFKITSNMKENLFRSISYIDVSCNYNKATLLGTLGMKVWRGKKFICSRNEHNPDCWDVELYGVVCIKVRGNIMSIHPKTIGMYSLDQVFELMAFFNLYPC